MMSAPLKVLVVGCGNMGASHARAYHKMDDFKIVGVVSRGSESRGRVSSELGGLPEFDNFEKALESTKPDAVAISTYAETHADYCVKAMRQGAHVFVEKPLAPTIEEARRVVDIASETNRKVVVGYILRHHPSWARFVEIARELGKPLVMRMNLNQQSMGSQWITHRNLMNSEGVFARKDDLIDMSDEPSHDDLCCREQAYFLKAIQEDLDLSDHLEDAVNSLRIVLAADKSIRTKKPIEL